MRASLTLFWWGARSRRLQLNSALPITGCHYKYLLRVCGQLPPGTTLTRSVAYLFLVVGAIGLVKTLGANEIMETAWIYGPLAAVSLSNI